MALTQSLSETYFWRITSQKNVKMKNQILCCYALLICSITMHAQTQKWAVASDATGKSDIAYTTDIDKDGNQYVAGSYADTLYINGIAYPNYSNDGTRDAYVAKYNAAGVLQWVKTINGQSDQQIRCLKVNKLTGECYVSGNFYYNFFIDGIQQNVFEYVTFPGSFGRTFLVKFDTNGNLSWSNDTYSEAEYAVDGAYSIALAPDGASVYFHTAYISDVHFKTGEEYLPFGFGVQGHLLTRMSASTGAVLNARNDIERYLVDGNLLSTDASGNVIFAGSYRRNCMQEVDAIFGTCLVNPSFATPEGFIWKMDAVFNSIWGKQISGTGFETVDAIGTDNAGNVYAYGTFNSQTHFDAITLDTVGGMDNLFVAKLSPSGNYSYIKQLYGDNLYTTIFPADLEAPFAVDKTGNVFLGGSFTGSLHVQSGLITTEVFPSPYYTNGFIIKLNNKGKFRWAEKFAGNTGPFDATAVHGIGLNGSNISLCGHMILYNAYQGDTLTSDQDAFYMSALQDCDIAIKITASAMAANALNPVTLSTALKPGYSYQWQKNNVNIPGATSNTYVTSTAGNFKCIVTTGACTLTSNKIKITLLPRLGETEMPSFSLYPNPSNGNIWLNPDARFTGTEVMITITDIPGAILLTQKVKLESSPLHIELPANIASGTYIITMMGSAGNCTASLVIE